MQPFLQLLDNVPAGAEGSGSGGNFREDFAEDLFSRRLTGDAQSPELDLLQSVPDPWCPGPRTLKAGVSEVNGRKGSAEGMGRRVG